MPRIDKTIAEFIGERELFRVAPDDPVSSALEHMKRGTDAVVVLDGDKLAGIFTQRDFLNRVTAVHRDASTTRMRDVMTTEPDVLSATDCITYAINHMALRGFRNIPIVEADGSVRAVLTSRDVVSHLTDVFAELEEDVRDGWDEWTDLGGGA